MIDTRKREDIVEHKESHPSGFELVQYQYGAQFLLLERKFIVYIGHNENNYKWDKELKELYNFFSLISDDFFNRFFEIMRCLHLDIIYVNEEPSFGLYSLPYEKYKNGYAFQFDDSFRVYHLNTEFLNKLGIYDARDRDWSQITMFFKDLNYENIELCFNRYLNLIDLQKSLASYILRAESDFMGTNPFKEFK